ncbi:MAG: TPM domain-containing protein [Saprospiraceae bacterium]|nr:TPM domain-containing protein [Saprospiraceae bacterium]
MFWTKKKKFFNKIEEERIMAAIRTAEKASSGEIRVYVETSCPDSVEKRTIEIFKKLKMYLTRERNGVLIYIAMESRKFAILGDEGIHKKMGFSFWTNEAAALKTFLSEDKTVEGVCKVIIDIGEVLKEHFPHLDDDKNELPDAPVYGK